jgi:Zn-dependent oligopeptidase
MARSASQKSQLLMGKKNFAEWEDSRPMAQTPERAMRILLAKKNRSACSGC